MFNQVGWPEFALLVVLGLFLFGPERLPRIAGEIGRGIRQLRSMAHNVTQDISAELGPEVGDLDLRSLNPRTLVERTLFDDPEPERPRRSSRPPATDEPAPYDAEAT